MAQVIESSEVAAPSETPLVQCSWEELQTLKDDASGTELGLFVQDFEAVIPRYPTAIPNHVPIELVMILKRIRFCTLAFTEAVKARCFKVALLIAGVRWNALDEEQVKEVMTLMYTPDDKTYQSIVTTLATKSDCGCITHDFCDCDSGVIDLAKDPNFAKRVQEEAAEDTPNPKRLKAKKQE